MDKLSTIQILAGAGIILTAVTSCNRSADLNENREKPNKYFILANDLAYENKILYKNAHNTADPNTIIYSVQL